MKREPDQRKAFLDKACGEDEALRSEVESLLAAEAKAAHFLDPPQNGNPMKGCLPPDGIMSGACLWRTCPS